MREKFPQIVGWKASLYHNVGEHNREAESGNPPAQFIVVGEEVDNRPEPANSLQIGAPESERRAQPETQTSLQLTRHQHAGAEICADAERFQLRAEG